MRAIGPKKLKKCIAWLADKGGVTPAEPADSRPGTSVYPEMPRVLLRHTAAMLLDAERGERLRFTQTSG
jgi:hypothetical protein